MFKLLPPEKTGVHFINRVTETDSLNIMSYEYIYNGAGVGAGDLNNDGLMDLVFAGNQVPPAVYLNLGNFKFKDISTNLSSLPYRQWLSGVAIADVNGDGWLDIYMTSTASNNPEKCKNRLWINQGMKDANGPYFIEMAEQYGIADTSQSVSAAFFDYDCDGDLDLYILNNTLTSRMNTSYRAKINDGTAGNNDQLYRNNGDGTFTNVTHQAGIIYEGFGLGVAIGDVNKDGYPDLYINNDYISNDLFYINQKDGTFKNEIRKYISYQTKSSMGNDMADVNNDGLPDIFTLDMMPENYSKIKQTINGFSYIYYVNDEKFGYEHQYLRNMLHLHNGLINGELIPYSEVGQMAGIFKSEWSWSPLFADYDNDGDQDLLIANGYPRDLTDKDWTFYKVKVFGFVADEKHVIEMAPVVKVQNFAFENLDRIHFRKRSKEWLPNIPSFSYGAVFVDLDNDGDLDYVTNNLNDPAFVMKNTLREKSKNKTGFLRLKLVGNGKNTHAIGAKVELWSEGNYQFRELFLTRGYASSVEPIIHFGTGNTRIIDSVKITWPASGNITLLKNIQTNQLLEIKESESSFPANGKMLPEHHQYMFQKNDSIIHYTHLQKDFIDFFYAQPVLPHKFSQIGPVMAKGDIDGDKNEDIIIGCTNVLPTTIFLRKGDVFVKDSIPELSTRKPFSESAISIVDIDNDGDNDIIILAGGYENPKDEDYKHYLYRNNNGTYVREDLPVPGFPAVTLRPFDFNHDGFTDIFIGSRVKKGRYPFANKSWLILNEKGNFKSDEKLSYDIGMVTDAVWSDIDNDGWEDLVITREWNSVAVLKNNGGKSLEVMNVPDLSDFKGIWFSIAAGDFDRDGDDDYIIGNFGENNRFNISKKYPMNIYALDLDMDGNLDPITTGYWKNPKGKMTEYPVNYFDELRGQSVYFSKLFENYAEFSYADIHRIIPQSLMEKVELKLSINTLSSYLVWNNNGKFTWEKLPLQIQMSPVKKMIVRDLNGDGYPDIIVTGNDHTYDIATGYIDANKGLILINNGDRTFKVMTPSESGLLLNGMVESLLWFEEDEPLLIAGINRLGTVAYRFKENGIRKNNK